MFRTALIAGGIAIGIATAPIAGATPTTTTPTPAPANSSGTYYPNCAAARAAGAAPIQQGQPGYRAALDRDGDGIACE
ncbi:MAG: excalibur calcium-binding domain-containing protein [Candidatus Sericytochromatia bacterium]